VKAPKLMDCTVHDAESELFIVEGDSAARSLTSIRDPSYQAVLPMQGKPMNAHRSGLRDLQKNVQLAALSAALGVELGAPSTGLEVRYERIILLFDPDADGIHARTLMLFFFHRWLGPLLDAGRVFDTHAPLWQVTGDGLDRPVYAGTPASLKRIRARLRDEGVTSVWAKRFRGLGNIDPELLRDRCVDPRTRTLYPLSAQDATRALALFGAIRATGPA